MKELMHKGKYGKPLCRIAKEGDYITHNNLVNISCPDCLKIIEEELK